MHYFWHRWCVSGDLSPRRMDHREFSGVLPRKLRDPLGIIPKCVMVSMVASMRTHYEVVQRCLWSDFSIERGLCVGSRRMFHLEKDVAHLEAELIKMRDARLVIIDPITAYLGGVDTHRHSDVRGVLGLVADLAARNRVAVVVISHWNKTGAGSAMNRITGSGAFVAAVRAAFMVARDPDDNSDTRRLFVPIKNNLAPRGDGLAFRLEQHLIGDIVASAIAWENEKVTRTADEILAAAYHDCEQQSVLDEATDWLKELLADAPVDTNQVHAQAKAAGLTWATVKRAKSRLGIKPQRRSQGGDGKGKWIWALPSQGAQGAQEVQDAHAPAVNPLEDVEHLATQKGPNQDHGSPGAVR
jgi:hypothetical protein